MKLYAIFCSIEKNCSKPMEIYANSIWFDSHDIRVAKINWTKANAKRDKAVPSKIAQTNQSNIIIVKISSKKLKTIHSIKLHV